ncbi:MAG: aminopeptidase P family protein [Planctomycetes bacterium]|nr:aminopeptidase P family protein [Planctomycetota bacterium]
MSELFPENPTRRQLARGFLVAAGSTVMAACAGGRPAPAAARDDDRTRWRADVASRLNDLAPVATALPPLDRAIYEDRIERLRLAMRHESVAAMLLGPTVNLQYFMGFSWGASERLFGVLIFQSGDFAWIAPKFEESRARELIGSRGEVHTWEEWEDPHVLAARVVSKRARGQLLAVDSHLRATHAVRIAKALGEKYVTDGLPVTARVRSIKGAGELARIRRACEITKIALEIVRDRFLVPGCEEAIAAEAMNIAQQRLGLTKTWCLALFAENAAFPHGTKQRRPLRASDLALLDTGGELDGYQSDITRTFSAGEPTPRQREVYRCVRNAQKAALAAAKPGASCESVDAAARAVVAMSGFGSSTEYFTHRLGHGIGMEGHEDPYFCPGNTTILAPGMTLSNEPGIYLPGELGVRIEDIVAITREGAEIYGPPADDELR